MEIRILWAVVLSAISLSLMVPSTVNSDPIKIDFNQCQTAEYPLNPTAPNGPQDSYQCCPIKPTEPIIDGGPPPSTSFLRVRQASQCTDEKYAKKIKRGYELMRALPYDDPRSLARQWQLHCAYCGGSFLVANSTGIPEGIDIHFSWLFYPWHRWFMFFHERILQSLLEDPAFSLNYWNWDSPYTVGDGSSRHGSCLVQGDDFPDVFSNPWDTTYDQNRSQNAKGNGRLRFPDFQFSPLLPAVQQPNYNASEEYLIASNMNIMYQSLVSGGTTTELFMGRPYRAGELRGNAAPNGGAGTLESTAHPTVHFWTGLDPPTLDDMGALVHSARDPVFFAHHSNIDRLWQVWKDIGPLLGQKREYYSDPDFLNAEFLFYDENKDLRRVKIEDALDTKKLGYVYQGANDAAWIFANQTKCSQLSYLELIAKAESLEAPCKNSDGYYELQAGTPFIIVVDRPDNPHGLEEFLTIDNIKLDRSTNGGFEVFIDLLNPTDYPASGRCAEYSGRFTNMAQSRKSAHGFEAFVWKQSVTRTFVDIQAPIAPSKVVITLIPFSQPGGSETIKFTSITIDT